MIDLVYNRLASADEDLPHTTTIRFHNIKMKGSIASSLLFANAALAFPWVRDVPGVNSAPLVARQQAPEPGGPGSAETCPFNPNHVNAPEVTAQFPYNNAKNGRKGNEKGGYIVPAPGDTVHRFIAPTARDIRGPCPGLNVAANHGFLARDGVTTFNELVNAQQNIYNGMFHIAIITFLRRSLTVCSRLRPFPSVGIPRSPGRR